MSDTFQSETAKSSEEVINELLANDKVRENCLINAKDLMNLSKGNWFTIDQILKKTKEGNPDAVRDIIDLLTLFGMCYRKIIKGEIVKFKITISKDDRIKLLQEELANAEETVAILKKQIDDISKN